MKKWMISLLFLLIPVYSLTLEPMICGYLWQGEYTISDLHLEFILRMIAAVLCCSVIAFGILQITKETDILYLVALVMGIFYSVVAIYQEKLYLGDYAFSFRFIVAMYMVMSIYWCNRKIHQKKNS